ncbi:putative 20S rRNA accumulation protein [Erysiphe necator]|uniref:Putative pdcd2 c terminal domain-containing protein n=1 Tax=Uncinula necator TaxID=52586 RepID=A0A0B1P0R9_UNCNE|nr:putative 20S rRNA accumulation protein [Erysiphe necator]KHJ30521.1 putative pdcd2 c terminal domain-containing protein [Erysiphe necator]
MAQFDSESSSDENDDYTETNVLLGYASGETSDDKTSHLGGQPHWIDSLTPPSASLVKCKTCHNFMALLLQLNGCLPEKFPGHERRLYLWICRRNLCKRTDGSVRVLRGLQVSGVDHLEKKNDEKIREGTPSSGREEKLEVNLGEVLFGTKKILNLHGNPFSSGGKPSSNPFAPSNSKSLNSTVTTVTSHPPGTRTRDNNLSERFAESLSLNNHCLDKSKEPSSPVAETWPSNSEFPPAYPMLYLVDSDYEILDIEEKKIPNHLEKMEIDSENNKGQGSSKEDKLIFESSIDQTFQKFADRMSQNPEQVIRYEYNGQPLLYAKNDRVGKLFNYGGNEGLKLATVTTSSNRIPRCENCGASRVFEFQLTPHAISELEKGDDNIMDGMEWGTIIVGVCQNDCQQKGVTDGVGYLEEWVGVQWEELK